MKKLASAISGAVIAATAFNSVAMAQDQIDIQSLYKNMPQVLQDALYVHGVTQEQQKQGIRLENTTFDVLRPRDQNPASYCDEDNNRNTQPLSALVMADENGALETIAVDSGAEAIKTFQESDNNYALAYNPYQEAVRAYMKDANGDILVARPLAAKPVGPSADVAYECLSEITVKADNVTIDVSGFPQIDKFSEYLNGFENDANEFNASQWNMTHLPAANGEQERPALLYRDDNFDQRISADERSGESRDLTMFFYDNSEQTTLNVSVKDSRAIYDVLDKKDVQWAVVADMASGNPRALFAKNIDGQMMFTEDTQLPKILKNSPLDINDQPIPDTHTPALGKGFKF